MGFKGEKRKVPSSLSFAFLKSHGKQSCFMLTRYSALYKTDQKILPDFFQYVRKTLTITQGQQRNSNLLQRISDHILESSPPFFPNLEKRRKKQTGRVRVSSIKKLLLDCNPGKKFLLSRPKTAFLSRSLSKVRKLQFRALNEY